MIWSEEIQSGVQEGRMSYLSISGKDIFGRFGGEMTSINKIPFRILGRRTEELQTVDQS